jgi:hypothetical protein
VRRHCPKSTRSPADSYNTRLELLLNVVALLWSLPASGDKPEDLRHREALHYPITRPQTPLKTGKLFEESSIW